MGAGGAFRHEDTALPSQPDLFAFGAVVVLGDLELAEAVVVVLDRGEVVAPSAGVVPSGCAGSAGAIV